MQEQEKLSDVAAELDLRYQQAEIINAVAVPYSERFWSVEGKLGIWVLPSAALAAHFWLICLLDRTYGFGLGMAVHLADPVILKIVVMFTALWVVFAPLLVAFVVVVCGLTGDWFEDRLIYTSKLKKAIEKANALRYKLEPYKGITIREYNEALLRPAKLAMGLAVPTLENFERPPGLNPHIVTLEMLGVEQVESRGASCMMPKI